MYDVREVPFGVVCATCLWLSDLAAKEIGEFRKNGDPNGAFWKKVKRCAESGFPLYERGDWPPVKHEWDGVYRFGCRTSLFRIIGFYEDEEKAAFIGIRTFLKHGQKLSGPERDIIDEVAKVKKDHLWRKVTHDGFPRVAQ